MKEKSSAEDLQSTKLYCISSTFTQYTGNNPDLKYPGQSTFDA